MTSKAPIPLARRGMSISQPRFRRSIIRVETDGLLQLGDGLCVHTWLEAAADDGFPCYPLFEKDTNLDSLRQDEKFVTFRAKQKQQWEHYKTTL